MGGIIIIPIAMILATLLVASVTAENDKIRMKCLVYFAIFLFITLLWLLLR